MNTIIVPLDFSQQSENALKVAAQIAKGHGATIIALHMLEISPAVISGSEVIHQEQTLFLIKLAEKRFSEFLSKPYLEGITISPVVKHYKVFSEVNGIANNYNADLIVMGSHGTDGLEEIFIGSNTERVVRTAEVPVLVIKEDIPNFKVERFAFACDFEEDNIPAFKKAVDFATNFGTTLHAFYVNTPGDEFLSTEDIYSKISKFLNLAKVGIEVEIYNDYSIEKGILNFSESIGADLIGIPTHGRKGLSHFFMGSIGEDVANHAQTPVITFKI